MNNWQSEIQAELDNAMQAQQRGNEGQARVCARRAAGIAIREYLTRRTIRPPSASAYDLLNLIKDDPLLPPNLKLIADHLPVRDEKLYQTLQPVLQRQKYFVMNCLNKKETFKLVT